MSETFHLATIHGQAAEVAAMANAMARGLTKCNTRSLRSMRRKLEGAIASIDSMLPSRPEADKVL